MKTLVQQRLLNLSAEIAASPPDELAFQHSVLTQTCLPTSKPPEGVVVWERQQGRARLRVEAGSVLDPKTGQYVQLGLPYGPRAVQRCWMGCTEAALLHTRGEVGG